MFGNKSNKDTTGAKKGTLLHNSIIAGTTINGNLKADKDIRIDGVLYGNLQCSARVVLGPEGYIKGNILAESARIEGKVDGNIKIKEMLEVKNSAHITGDILTHKLIINDGAEFNGQCTMGKRSIQEIPTTDAKLKEKRIEPKALRKEQKAG